MRAAPASVVAMVVPAEAVAILRSVLAQFPPDFAAAIVILVHTGEGHERPIAHNLNTSSSLMVTPGTDGTPLREGYATVVQSSQSLIVGSGGVLAPQHGTETLLMSLAARYRERAFGIALTALSNREAQDFRSMREVGGHTFALDETDFLWTLPPGPRVAPAEGDEVLPASALVGRISALLARTPAIV